MNALLKAVRDIGRNIHGRPVVIAHRGASAIAPENTITAFDLACDQGADAVEFDVRLTSDGDLVVMHDARTSRTTPAMKVVASTTCEEICSLDAGSWRDRDFRGEKVPSLLEALDSMKRRVVPVIEIKDSGADGVKAARRVVDVLKEAKTDAVVVSSHPESLDAVRGFRPKTPCALIAMRHKTAVAALDDYDGCFIWLRAFSPELAGKAATLGRFAAPWVVPNKRVAEVAKSGVQAFLTDDPASALAALRGSK